MISGKITALLGAILLGLVFLMLAPHALADTDALSANGKILTIDLGAKKLQILKTDGTTLTLKYSKKTTIERNGKTAKIKALLLQDAIQAKYKAGLTAVKFSATGPASRKIAGKLENALKGNGTVSVNGRLVQTTAQTRIVRNGQAVSLSSLARQDKLVAHVKPSATEGSGGDEAFDLIADGPEDDELHGTISAIVGNQVTITPSNGTADVTVNVTDTTMIEVDGEDAALADLAVGMQVEAHYDAVTLDAFSIETDSQGEEDDGHVSGTVAAVDPVAGTITITPTIGDPVTLTVDAGTEIEVNGEHGALGDVQPGMPVRAEYDTATLLAKEIKAGDDFGGDDEEDQYVEGIIAAVDVGAASVTVTPDGGGSDLVLTITSESEIEVNDHDGSIDDLQVGQAVKVKYLTSSMEVEKLKVGDDGGGDDNGNENTNENQNDNGDNDNGDNGNTNGNDNGINP